MQRGKLLTKLSHPLLPRKGKLRSLVTEAHLLQANGYLSAGQNDETGVPGNDTASIERHVLKLSTEAATLQEVGCKITYIF